MEMLSLMAKELAKTYTIHKEKETERVAEAANEIEELETE